MSGPLVGVRVVDMTALLPGPLCTMHLGDLGADVIKIENPRSPDPLRDMFSPGGGGESGGPSGMFLMLNRNKRSLSLNIKRPDGRTILRRLLEKADILIEGFRPQTMRSMELNYEILAPDFPRLIYCSLSGYGENGPASNRAGHDGNFAALSGLIDLNREKGGDPLLPPVQIADLAGAELALSSILAALYVRERNGRGQLLDLSLFDAAFSRLPLQAGALMEDVGRRRRKEDPLSGALPNYRLYRCADDRHVMLAALEPRFVRTLLRRLKREDLIPSGDPEGRDLTRLGEELAAIFASRPRDGWRFLFEDDEVCLSPVVTLEEAFQDPGLRARGMVVSGEHPRLGALELIGAPFRFSDTPCTYRLPPPDPGEHTAEILTDLGYSSAEQADFRRRRLI